MLEVENFGAVERGYYGLVVTATVFVNIAAHHTVDSAS
jgi:hypothetical protein